MQVMPEIGEIAKGVAPMKTEREVCPFCESLDYGCHISVALDDNGKQQWICRKPKTDHGFADALADLVKHLGKEL